MWFCYKDKFPFDSISSTLFRNIAIVAGLVRQQPPRIIFGRLLFVDESDDSHTSLMSWTAAIN